MINNSTGRPTLLNDTIKHQSREYISFFIKANKDELENRTEVLPSLSGLALYLGIARETLYNWQKSDQEFLDILEELRCTQEILLLNNGLKGKYNSTITKMMLTKHGYSDKPKIEHNDNTYPTVIKLVAVDPIQTKEIIRELQQEI